MTVKKEHEERAGEAVDVGASFYHENWKNYNGYKGFKTKRECIIDEVAQALADLEAEVVERCAKVAENNGCKLCSCGQHIAITEMIRNKGGIVE